MIARLALLVVLVATARAHAQPVEGMIGKDRLKLEIDDCPVQTVSGDKLRQIGSEHYSRGEVLYAQGDYRGAVDELAAAYCLAPFYSILKDIGLAYERELDFERAIAYLERYVMAVPRDAKPANTCAIDPQEDKKNVLARIRVLQGLEAHISIETEPSDAQITLSSKDTGVTNRTTSGHEMKVLGGHYTMTVERPGFQTKTRDIKAEIGKPYEFFEKLEPQKGRLYVRVVPSEARLYLDRRPFGTGTIATELEGGHYQLLAESEGRLRITKEVEVIPDRETSLAFELPPEPELGRKQFLAFSVFAGGFLGGGLVGAQNNNTYSAIAAALGAAGGFAGAYFGTPDNLALGTSSLAITSSAIGGGFGAGVAAMFTNDGNTAAPIIAAGVATGGSLGYYLGDTLHVSPGDAAVINSGALWGTVTGALLAISFESGNAVGTHLPDSDRRVAAGIVLAGLGMGTTGGVLLQRYVTVSRGHAALVDTGGVIGGFAALAGLQIYTRAAGAETSDERTSNVVLGGVAAGLIVAGVLTRQMDEQYNLTPTIGKTAQNATTFGVGGSF
jgi:tetratricopeptide (TPR) repeat protein